MMQEWKRMGLVEKVGMVFGATITAICILACWAIAIIFLG